MSLEKDISKMITDLKDNIDISIPNLEKEIDFIISNKITSEKRIEKILDTLLDYSYFADVEKLFQNLNRYYFTVNEENSKCYDKFYNELF